ncbi:MAG: hypothetical protein NPIRA02_02470 [Nitrospirales bacterium]|nr:MAG: hypothetical protein NPIRA02_02470 [Nitrospirales bacterium]
MARAIVARRNGDDFQARLFWLKAASLLDPGSSIVKVAYETGPTGFDDILIEYDSNKPIHDHQGKAIYRDHLHCKWHTTAGSFGYEDLIEPSFINAERFSFLQRAYQAHTQYAEDGFGHRFTLLTNWRIKHQDPLQKLVRKESDALDNELLFDGSTDRSRMGKVRKLWREHLEVDDEALSFVARTLAIAETPESLLSLRERLDEKLAAVGMKRIPASESGFFYDDLIIKLLGQGRIVFDRNTFPEMARREGLLESSNTATHVPIIGVRSFMHPIDSLEERCDQILNIVPYFDGRYIRNDADWENRIFPELRTFLFENARSTDHLRLIVDAHVSIAFAIGALLNVKSGKSLEIEQRGRGRRFWANDDSPIDKSWPNIEFEEQDFSIKEHKEIALAVSLTHNVSPSVRTFVKQKLPEVSQIIHCAPEGGSSQHSVRSGRHAGILAEAIVHRLQDSRVNGQGTGRTHIFIAGPNAFTFSLGQHQHAIGPVTIYEWDFDGQRGGGYSSGLCL